MDFVDFCEHNFTSLQSCRSCTGFLFVDELNSSSHAWCISRWLDKHRCIWLPTSSLLPTPTTLSFGPRLKGYASFHAHTTVSATEVSLLPVLVCGTPCCHLLQDMNYRHFKQSLKGHVFRL